MTTSVADALGQKSLLGLRLYAFVGIIIGALLVLLFLSLSLWISYRKRVKMMKLPTSNIQASHKVLSTMLQPRYIAASKPLSQALVELPTNSSGTISEDRITVEKEIVHIRQGSTETPSSAETHKTTPVAAKGTQDNATITKESRFESSSNSINTMEGLDRTSSFGGTSSSPSEALVSHLGWGHWYSLRDLEVATGHFAESNVVGKGGYGIVYHGILTDGTNIAVKKLAYVVFYIEKERKSSRRLLS